MFYNIVIKLRYWSEISIFRFDDLKDIYPLRFDFAIFKNNKLVGLIEYQGEQHWSKSNGFYSEDIIRHDEMKKEYCKNNNIILIEVKYKKNYDIKYEDLCIERMLNE